jgi:hypothetical protein
MWVSASKMYVVLIYARICILFVQFNFLPDGLPSFVLKITPSENKQFVCNKNIAKLIVSLFEWMANRAQTIQCSTFQGLFYVRIWTRTEKGDNVINIYVIRITLHTEASKQFCVKLILRSKKVLGWIFASEIDCSDWRLYKFSVSPDNAKSYYDVTWDINCLEHNIKYTSSSTILHYFHLDFIDCYYTVTYEGSVGVSGAVRQLLAAGGTTELLLIGVTDWYATAHIENIKHLD